MITYLKRNLDDISQCVEIDLSQIEINERRNIETNITNLFGVYEPSKSIAGVPPKSQKLIYKTEILIPKNINKCKRNLLIVIGNPAIHSLENGMFFSYERLKNNKWREHRFWRALRECGILNFSKAIPDPKQENIQSINNYKRDCLINNKYQSDFNIFILPYFSFPTPSSGENAYVTGIPKIVGRKLFNEMKINEFKRFNEIIHYHNIKNVICFQVTAREELLKRTNTLEACDYILKYPVYKLNEGLTGVTLYTSKQTGRILTDESKNVLKEILKRLNIKTREGST